MSNLINLVFCDSDKEYVHSFNEYLKGYERRSFDINFLTDISSMEEYCNNDNADLIIVAEYLIPKLNNSDFAKLYSDKIIVLGDEKEITHTDDFFTVYRYQHADSLISDILNICADMTMNTGKNVRYFRKVNTITVGIFSPVGRCGKTRFSIELAKSLAEEGRRGLLLNLEEFSLLDKYLGGNDEQNISDLLFYYLGGKGCFEVKSEAIIKSYCGFDYVSPVQCIYDLRNVESDIWDSFITDLGKIRGYEFIIIDISGMVKDYFELMEGMDIVFLPYLKDECSRYKISRMKVFLENSEHKDIIRKLMEISMDDYINESNSDVVKKAVIRLEGLIKGEKDWNRGTSEISN